MHEFFKYHVHYRPGQPNPYLCYGRLSKQIIVDCNLLLKIKTNYESSIYKEYLMQ
jgi:hypothetical protein